MADEEGPLCCCEYYNLRKRRTHMLTFCCECDEFDKGVDDWIKGNPQKLDRLTAIVETFCDRCRVPWFGGAKTFDFGSAFPPILLVISAYIACWHYILTILVFLALPLLIISCYIITIKLKMRTRLFLSLSISSTVGCFAVYFSNVAPFETLQINVALATSAIVTMICFQLSRQKPVTNQLISFTSNSALCKECSHTIPTRGKHCRICNQCVVQYDHHCVWIDSCIGHHNHKIFLLTVFLYLLNIIGGCYVTLLYICNWDAGFMPDCSQAYATNSSALLFVCCSYALVIGVALLVLLAQQIVLISFNITSHEWRHISHEASLWSTLKTSPYNKGIVTNWTEFIKT